jgi:hypothetical protein
VSQTSAKTKRVHHNGVYVGDIVTTGDDMKDAKLVTDFLAAKGVLLPTPTPAQAIFNQAASLTNASADIFEKHLDKTPPMAARRRPSWSTSCSASSSISKRSRFSTARRSWARVDKAVLEAAGAGEREHQARVRLACVKKPVGFRNSAN